MTEVQVKRSSFAVEVTAVTETDASPDAVWGVLTDFAAYPTWNPFIRRIDGAIRIGARLSVDLQPAGSTTTMRPTVVAAEPGLTFTWLGHVLLPGVLDGRHTFRVEALGTGTRFIQHERLSGALTPLFRRMLTIDTPQAFARMNDAVAARAAR